MPGGRELKQLELRRRELVLQSSLNRLAVRTELRNLRASIEPVQRVAASVRSVRPWLTLLAPLAGMLISRRAKSNGSIVSKAFGILKWTQALIGIVRQFKAHSNGAASEPKPEPFETEHER